MAIRRIETYDGATGELIGTEEIDVPDPPAAMDLAALAEEVVAMRGRQQAAEDALFFLLTSSLEV